MRSIYLYIKMDNFIPIEIKKNAAFKMFSKIENVTHGNLICLVPAQQPLFTNATAISIWDI
ncbi:MAG: hypothetical protein LBI80_03590 [Endomicrobium sp.]|nr:hypothetical protein [Endomicrobium sp.]